MNNNDITDPGHVFDVSEADFEAQVLERSQQVPVLLDCWAPWCGPCRTLTPLLEKLADDYGGRFVLAKLNSDENQGLAAALQLRSIPQVFLLKGGQVVEQFTGVLPESKIRALLDPHLPAPQVSPVEALREQAAAAPDEAAAEALLREALVHAPGHPEVTLDLAERCIARGDVDAAQALLDGLALSAAEQPRLAALQGRIELARHRPTGDAAALTARIAANAKDFDARFTLAALRAHDGNFDAAFDELLEIVMRDKTEWREKARVQLVEWFTICPDAAAVSRGRRYLGMYLN